MDVTPATLEFKGDFLSPSTEYLYIKNTSTGPLAFKVKTTAPKLYSVRPNASIVPPGESVKIAIILQAFSQPLSKHYKCKDKFLIVSLPCSSDADATKVSEFWPELEKAQKPNAISKKLKVNYVIEGTDEDEIQEEKDTSSKASSGAVPVAGSTTGAEVSPAAASAFGSAVAASNAVNQAKEPYALEPTETKGLADSYNTINKLNEKLDETEKEKTPTSAVKQESAFSGISLPLTIILMLLAFIIGWLIF